MAQVAAARPSEERRHRGIAWRDAATRGATIVLVLAALWGLWEGYKWVWETAGWTWPFVVDDTTMPHLHDIFGAFAEPATGGGPALIHPLLDAAWFTAKEALAGFLLGAVFGFALAVVLAHSRLLERGLLPYIFAALRISATASVIGAIIGETPASIQEGLGGAIVNFNQYYSLQPTFLWATNVVCAALGISFFALVALTERVVLRRAPENIA